MPHSSYEVHELKCMPKYFEQTWRDDKAFEIRHNDRNYAVGDGVLLLEYCLDSDMYTGRSITGVITSVVTYAQRRGNVVFGLKVLTKHDRRTA